jgi:hypothetical protein
VESSSLPEERLSKGDESGTGNMPSVGGGKKTPLAEKMREKSGSREEQTVVGNYPVP